MPTATITKIDQLDAAARWGLVFTDYPARRAALLDQLALELVTWAAQLDLFATMAD